MKINLLKRENRINAIYYHYLFKWNFLQLTNSQTELKLNEPQINTLKEILENKEELEKLIQDNITNNWSWENISPLSRAILLNGAAEIKLFKNKKAIVIKESNNFAAKYVGQEPIPMITAILDKIN